MMRALLAGLVIVALALALLAAVLFVPPLLLDVDQIRDIHQVSDPAKRLDEVSALRTTMAGVLGGLAVAAGAIVAALNFRETSRQNRAVLELQRRGQVTERFTKAIDQLGQGGDEKFDVRIGAIYALEQIARDSKELHWAIMEVLTAHLRVHRPFHGRAADGSLWDIVRPPADHQAIATVIGRRDVSRESPGQVLDLHGTWLASFDWSGAKLQNADLHGADLREAVLYGADLKGANLQGAFAKGARGLTREQLDSAGNGGLADCDGSEING